MRQVDGDAGIWDVVVVGAGLAGLRAARDCADAGLAVLVLEARDRVGGRAFTGGAAELGADVELGGTWIAPGHDEVLNELVRYGLGRRDYSAPTDVRWRADGVLRTGLPVPFGDLPILESTIVRVHADAVTRLDELSSLTCAAYLDTLDVPPAITDLFRGWFVMITGSRLDEVSIVDGLSTVAHHGGLVALMTALEASPTSGWSELARRMAASDGVTVRLRTPVSSIGVDADLVSVATGAGVTERGLRAIIAVPVNVLPDLDIRDITTPAIERGKGGNIGRVAKVWMLADGVPEGALASGVGEGLDWLYAPGSHDGATLVLGFGLPGESFDPNDRSDVERALHAFYPDASLRAFHHHDWVADPFSRGTYVSVPAAAPDLFDAEAWHTDGLVSFAGSDIAAEEPGWFEGALRSGAAAAAHAIHQLDVRRTSGPVPG